MRYNDGQSNSNEVKKTKNGINTEKRYRQVIAAFLTSRQERMWQITPKSRLNGLEENRSMHLYDLTMNFVSGKFLQPFLYRWAAIGKY